MKATKMSKEFTAEEIYNYHHTSFGEALTMLQRGKKISRRGWNGRNMYLLLIDNVSLGNFQKDNEFDEELFTLQYRLESIILLKTTSGKFVPWCPSQTDILSEDWQIYTLEDHLE